MGLAGTAGITEVDIGTGDGLDDYAAAIGTVEAAGARPSVILMSPSRWTALLQTKDATGSIRPLLSSQAIGPTGETQRSIFGVEVRTTAACPEDVAYVVDGSRVSVVVRRDGTVAADASFRFSADITTVRATARLAWAVPYPGAVVRLAPA